MSPNPFLGILLHALGGFAAGSFYIPFKQVRGWAWESYWLVGGVFSWIIAPWLMAFLVCPELSQVIGAAPGRSLFWSYFFGVLWGIGGLTFGLSMRYLGMSLGYALALGFCAAFGTMLPPLVNGQFPMLVATRSGRITLAGVLICLTGIAICGKAGVAKERELTQDQKKATIQEFNFAKGVWVAVLAGIMSACMAFGIAAGKPIASLAIEHGTPVLWQNTPIFVVILAGGFTTNCVWCLVLNWRNRTGRDYFRRGHISLAANYLFSALAGVTWYFQFFFYGMGTTRMGRYDFSSWTIHMAFIIIFSNLWGLIFKEWKGSSSRTHHLVFAGILVLITSTLVIGLGNYAADSASPSR
ncbi:MAG: L-rhamnose/proton symporter RhaT [Verrucomicrobia bacterium]|nr:L-rhamnose/proton symporter RhaT [Verrucomicrobiota bacterium]